MDIIEKLQKRAIRSKNLDAACAMRIFEEGATRPFRVMAAAADICRHFKESNISLCAIMNAKSGKCPEDCKFCAQSARYDTGVMTYPLKKTSEIIQEAYKARLAGAEMFGIVISGRHVTKKDLREIVKAIREINAMGIKTCASLGIIDGQTARILKEAGLYRYHHNLETSRSFFPKICSTHSYEEGIMTIHAAKTAGLSVCCGGIIGMGEGIGHRIEFALTLRDMDVDSIPINILNPITGTPLAETRPLPPLEILMTIAVFRFLLPDRDIRLCGGKEKNLRQLLPLGLVAGANALMTGNYLTTPGRQTDLDMEMINDLGLRVSFDSEHDCNCASVIASSN